MTAQPDATAEKRRERQPWISILACLVVAIGSFVYTADGWHTLMTELGMPLWLVPPAMCELYTFIALPQALDPRQDAALRKWALWTSIGAVTISALGSAAGHVIAASTYWFLSALIPLVLTGLFISSAHLISLLKARHRERTEEPAVKPQKTKKPKRDKGSHGQAVQVRAVDDTASRQPGPTHQSAEDARVLRIDEHRTQPDMSSKQRGQAAREYARERLEQTGTLPQTGELVQKFDVSDRTGRTIRSELETDSAAGQLTGVGSG